MFQSVLILALSTLHVNVWSLLVYLRWVDWRPVEVECLAHLLFYFLRWSGFIALMKIGTFRCVWSAFFLTVGNVLFCTSANIPNVVAVLMYWASSHTRCCWVSWLHSWKSFLTTAHWSEAPKLIQLTQFKCDIDKTLDKIWGTASPVCRFAP